MANPRINLYDFSREVKLMMDYQQDYFSAKRLKGETYRTLKKAQKQEKVVTGLITSISLDKKELDQSNLFEPVQQSQIEAKGLVTPGQLARLYGQPIKCEYLTKDGFEWLPVAGKVNAITIRHAELGRIRNLQTAAIKTKEVQRG